MVNLLRVAFGPVFAIAIFIASPLQATAAESEITIRNTAFQGMLADRIFVDRGKYFLMRHSECQFAFLRAPEVVIASGRVTMKTELVGQLAMAVSDGCAGTRDAFDVTISGRPYFSGESLGLTDIRLDNVSNDIYRKLLQQFLDLTLSEALEFNLREELQQAMAAQEASYEVTVSRLSVSKLTAEDNQIYARLSFALSAR